MVTSGRSKQDAVMPDAPLLAITQDPNPFRPYEKPDPVQRTGMIERFVT